MILRRLTLLTVVLGLLLVPPAGAAKKKQKKVDPAEATNFLLGLDYSHWLVGPAFFIATEEERATYLALTSDEEARDFIEEFWKRRDPDPEFFGNEVRQLFEQRAAVADKRFREGARLGRRTARGAIYVLYGEPREVIYDTSIKRNEPNLEVWVYSGDGEPGLDGEPPRARYWFAEKDGQVVAHIPRAGRRNTIRQ